VAGTSCVEGAGGTQLAGGGFDGGGFPPLPQPLSLPLPLSPPPMQLNVKTLSPVLSPGSPVAKVESLPVVAGEPWEVREGGALGTVCANAGVPRHPAAINAAMQAAASGFTVFMQLPLREIGCTQQSAAGTPGPRG